MARRFDDRRGFDKYATVTPTIARVCLAMRTHHTCEKAGNVTGLSREAISHAVRRAEAVLGVQLFTRVKNGRNGWETIAGNAKHWSHIERVAK